MSIFDKSRLVEYSVAFIAFMSVPAFGEDITTRDCSPVLRDIQSNNMNVTIHCNTSLNEFSTDPGPPAPPLKLDLRGGDPNRTLLWGEDTILVELEGGQDVEIDGRNLWLHATAYPTTSCAGPGFIPFTWQVRTPYGRPPRGGELSVSSGIPRSGGRYEQLHLGTRGHDIMDSCSIIKFKNHSLEKILLEIRYASAVREY